MKYITLSQYKLSDDGIPLSDVTDVSLARYISRAESDLDSYVGLDLKRGGFEPHNVWLQSKFDERTRKMPFPSYPVCGDRTTTGSDILSLSGHLATRFTSADCADGL